MEFYDHVVASSPRSSQSQTTFFDLPLEVRLQVLLFNCPLPLSLIKSSAIKSPFLPGAGEAFYEVDCKHTLVRDAEAKLDFERQIRIAENCAAMRYDMLSVIEDRHRRLDKLDFKMRTLLNTNDLDDQTQWMGAMYRMWHRDERVLHEYVYYCFRVGLPLVSDLRNASYQLRKLQRDVANLSVLNPLANFGIPCAPNGLPATAKPSVIESRKRKLSEDLPKAPAVKDQASWRPVDEDWRTLNAQTWQTVPSHTVHFMKQHDSLRIGPVDEIENGSLFFEA